MSTILVLTYGVDDIGTSFGWGWDYKKAYRIHLEGRFGIFRPYSGRFYLPEPNIKKQLCYANTEIAHCLQKVNNFIRLHVRENISSVLLQMLKVDDSDVESENMGYGLCHSN